MKISIATKDQSRSTPTALIPKIVHEHMPSLVRSADGLSRLEKILKEDFPDEMLVKYLKDLCEAEDQKMTNAGSYSTPNWTARKDGLDRVLELLRHKKRAEAPASPSPVNLIFNVMNPSIQAKQVP